MRVAKWRWKALLPYQGLTSVITNHLNMYVPKALLQVHSSSIRNKSVFIIQYLYISYLKVFEMKVFEHNILVQWIIPNIVSTSYQSIYQKVFISYFKSVCLIYLPEAYVYLIWVSRYLHLILKVKSESTESV